VLIIGSRFEEYRHDPDKVVTWEELKARILRSALMEVVLLLSAEQGLQDAYRWVEEHRQGREQFFLQELNDASLNAEDLLVLLSDSQPQAWRMIQ